MLGSLAELERSTILERMAMGANRKAREGKWLGGIVPMATCLRASEASRTGTSRSDPRG
jgi:DNA invertase Pin-like site-specific DNA recombinase